MISAAIKKQILEPVVAIDPRFKTMADCAPVFLWMADHSGECIFFNEQWLKFTGRTLEKEVGYGWAEGIHHEDLQRCLDTYIKHFNARSGFEMTYRLRRHDGEYRWILDNGRPYNNDSGSFEGFIGSCIDITERIQIEEALKIRNKELKHLSDIKSDFVTMITHELRTPLASIMEGVNLIADGIDGPVSEAQTVTLDIVKRNISRLSRMVSNVLDFQKLESGIGVMEMKNADLTSIVNETLLSIQLEFDKKGVTLNAHLNASPIKINCDEDRIKQVLYNLFDNALKFTPTNGTVTVTLKTNPTHALISVTDTGDGIKQEDLETIFDMFNQSRDKGYWKTGGFGVGLCVCKKIVEKHQGEISVQSTPHQGSTFTVKLPLP